jgi:hypothetical protein
MRYVAANFGQQSVIRMQIPITSAAEMSAVGASGTTSATIIPEAAINARPTNG